MGKSTLVHLFAEAQRLDLMEVNLERHLYLDSVFKTYDVTIVLRELQAITNRPVTENTLLFLDEVQATPNALACLRYFKEDRPDLPIIAAGSLLEFTLANHSFSMPVGRIEYRHLGPMTYLEFLKAVAPELLMHWETIVAQETLPEYAHQQLMEQQRAFLLVGGMPEAVAIYRETRSFEAVYEVHRSICDTYLDDFSKYARRKELALLQRTFRMLPRLLGKKVKYQTISADDRAADVRSVVELLMKARVCHGVFAADCSGIPLNTGIDSKTFKPLFLDIGLVNHLTGVDWLALGALSNRDLVNEGALAEQFIGQHLVMSADMKKTPELCYWLREGRSSNAEVDYVISQGNWVIPIEVKAGKSGTLKSLQQFVHKKQPPLTIRFDMNPQSRQHVAVSIKADHQVHDIQFDLLSLPLYAVEALPQIIQTLRAQA